MNARGIDRRAFLQVGGSVLGGGVLAAALAACSSADTGSRGAGDPTTRPSRPTTTTTAAAASGPAVAALSAADFDAIGTCRLVPEKTAGPFPLDRQLDRRDVTEGLPGRPLRLGLRVVDARCTPVPDAAVEIWHCDATGDYSAFRDNGGGKDAAAGTTFLRGTQPATPDGIVEFATIYPGWYRGRAVHIHLRVHRDGATVLTSQLFFPDGYTDAVYASAPYAQFGTPDTRNADDSIAGDPKTEGTLLAVRDSGTDRGAGTLALLNLGVSA
jgi:protocatechuate 3,4-dioxygenase beta subunit